MGTAGLIESFELRQLNLVILSAAYSDISAGIISHEIMSAFSSCIFMTRQPVKACLVFLQRWEYLSVGRHALSVVRYKI